MIVRRIAAAAGLAVFGACLALVVAEVGLRASGLRRQFALPHATIGYVLTPSFSRSIPITDEPAHHVVLRTNNLGLRRDSDTTLQRRESVPRALILGDSQSEGIVDNTDTYAARLEAGLQPAEVLNGAVSGYSPLLSWLWWQDNGRRLAPDVVLLALYTGNDLAELLMRREDFGGFGPTFKIPYLRQSGAGFVLDLPGADGGALRRLEYMLRSHWRSYALLHRLLPRPTAAGTSDFAAVARYCAGCLQSMWQAYTLQTPTEAMPEATARLDFVLGQLRESVRQSGAELIIAVVPTKLQVEPQSMPSEISAAQRHLRLPEDGGAFDDRLHAAILEIAGDGAIDLLPPLRAAHADGGGDLYWRQDWHLNPRGHAAVAAALQPVLRDGLDRQSAKRHRPPP